MSMHTTIVRSVRPVVMSALSLGVAMITVSPPSSAAEPVRQQVAYSGWGAGPIAAALVQPVAPLHGMEAATSRNNLVEPVGNAPVTAAMPSAVPAPLEYIIPLSDAGRTPARSAQLERRAR